MKQVILGPAVLVTIATVLSLAPIASAATTADSELTQTINAGVLSTSILDAGGLPVASPSFAMSNTTASTTTTQTSTGAFGSDTQRITVDNPGSATGGWTLALAGATSAQWSGSAGSYPYNASTSGAGQLSITSSGTVTALVGGVTNVSGATAATFSDTVSAITIMSASSAAASNWNGYITGVGLSQTIPAGTPAGSYSIDMVQTITAV